MTLASMIASSRLAGISGPSHVMSDTLEVTPYAIGGNAPTAVVRPGSSEEIEEIVKFALAEKLALVPVAGRTKLGIGMPPHPYDLALDMTRLDRIIAYDPGDLTLSVESGVPLGKVAGVLAEHGQFLPLVVPFADRATIGGTIASGIDTALRQAYGTARDYVLGMEFVTGQGVSAKSGGRVVKNVTGYDIHKLMIGALGTLGAITKINFRTFPLPVTMRMLVAFFASFDNAVELRHRLARSPLAPMTLEIMSPQGSELLSGEGAARLSNHPSPASLFRPGHWTFTATFAGNEAVLRRCERDARQMAEQSGAASVSLLEEGEFQSALAGLREFVPIALQSSSATTIIKIGVLPTRMKEVLDAAIKAAETNLLAWAGMARGLGVIYFVLLPNECNEESRGRVLQATDQILAACSEMGGNATIPWCPAEWKSTLKVWGADRGDFDQMRKVKNVFDPHGIFAPGRFIGGL